MSLNNNETIDGKLEKVMIHEFSRCFNFFWQFANYTAEYVAYIDDRSNNLNVATYNSYSLFIHHLYEFIIACYKKENKFSTKAKFDVTDRWINNKVDEILKEYVYSIDNNLVSNLENDRDLYDIECPNDFARSFRIVRNNIAHTDHRRLCPNERISLSEFYVEYHQFVMLLFHNYKSSWLTQDYGDIDLGEITEFNNLIHSETILKLPITR